MCDKALSGNGNLCYCSLIFGHMSQNSENSDFFFFFGTELQTLFIFLAQQWRNQWNCISSKASY